MLERLRANNVVVTHEDRCRLAFAGLSLLRVGHHSCQSLPEDAYTIKIFFGMLRMMPAAKPSAAPPPSPWAGSDYPKTGRGPSTGEVGQLAKSIAELTGVSGIGALFAATLVDQGRTTEALDFLDGVLAERRAEAERRKPPLPNPTRPSTYQ